MVRDFSLSVDAAEHRVAIEEAHQLQQLEANENRIRVRATQTAAGATCS